MKKYLALLALSLTLPFLTQAQTAWEEGVHYEVIAAKASTSKNVREVFSFWCPHCFTFEPIAAQIKQNLPDKVKFTKAHVNFLGGASTDTQNAATSAMLAAKAMGKSQLFNQALFTAIHSEGKTISNMEDILAVFSAVGGDASKLEKLTKSFGIRSQIKRNNALIRGIPSVPAFIVNDKYKAIFTRDMTPDNFVELVNWLTTQK
jgi:thiol:disulfide interchange protein DsbA